MAGKCKQRAQRVLGRPVGAGPELISHVVELARHPKWTLQHHGIRRQLGGGNISTLGGIQASRAILFLSIVSGGHEIKPWWLGALLLLYAPTPALPSTSSLALKAAAEERG